LRLKFAALFLPQPQQGGLVVAHDDLRVRAADEAAAVRWKYLPIHENPPQKCLFSTEMILSDDKNKSIYFR
jgi:hypothetical protein